LKDREFAYLKSLIPQGKSAGMSNGKYADLMKDADRVLDEMKGKMECEMALAAAVRMKDLSSLDAAIKKMQFYNDASKTTQLNAAIRLRDELNGQESLIAQITAATEAKDNNALVGLLEKATALNITGRVIQDARQVLNREAMVAETLQHLKEANDIASLNLYLEKAIQLGMSGPEVDAARAKQTELTGVSTIEVLVKSAIKNITVVSSSEQGISEDAIKALESAIQQCEVDGASTSALNIINTAKDALALAKRQLQIQEQLLQITDESSVLEMSKCLRIAGEIGLKNFKGYNDVSMILSKRGDDILSRKQNQEEEAVDNSKFETKKEELYREAKQPNYQFTNFGNLRTPEEFAKGNLLNKRKIMDAMLKHQKTPIGHSLTKLDKEGENHALIVHKSLLGYCGDKAVTFPASLALDIINIGITYPNLRDEIFLQAIKHTIDNPSGHNQCRAMHIICLCCDTFSPSDSFYYYLINFLLYSIGDNLNSLDKNIELPPFQQMALYALSRVQAMLTMGTVEHVDVESIEAYSVRLPTIAKIYSPQDELLGELLVAPDVDVETLLILLCQILGIHVKHRPLFGLYIVTSKSSPLAPMTLLPDKDFYIGSVFQAPLLQKYGKPMKYYLKRKALGTSSVARFIDRTLDDGEETEEQIEALNSITFSQLSRRVIDESIRIVKHEKVAQLAAYMLAIDAEFIPDRPDIALGQGCLNFIPESLRDSYEPEYWGNLVARALSNCVGRSDEELQTFFIELLNTEFMTSMNTYLAIKGGGSTPGGVTHIPDDMIVGIDENGIHFINGETISVSYHVPYSDIKKIGMKQNSIKLTLEKVVGGNHHVGSTYDLELITPLNEEISQLIMLYRPASVETKQRPSEISRPTVSPPVYYFYILVYCLT
jgi:hypothetical protein